MHNPEAVSTAVRVRLQSYLQERQISEAELARQAGVGQSSLNRFLNGKTDEMTLQNLVRLANAMGLDAGDLVRQYTPPRVTRYASQQMATTLQAMESLPEPLQQAVAHLAQSLRDASDKPKP